MSASMESEWATRKQRIDPQLAAGPEAIRQRIGAATDLGRLNAAALGVIHLGRLEEFQL